MYCYSNNVSMYAKYISIILFRNKRKYICILWLMNNIIGNTLQVFYTYLINIVGDRKLDDTFYTNFSVDFETFYSDVFQFVFYE